MFPSCPGTLLWGLVKTGILHMRVEPFLSVGRASALGPLVSQCKSILGPPVSLSKTQVYCSSSGKRRIHHLPTCFFTGCMRPGCPLLPLASCHGRKALFRGSGATWMWQSQPLQNLDTKVRFRTCPATRVGVDPQESLEEPHSGKRRCVPTSADLEEGKALGGGPEQPNCGLDTLITNWVLMEFMA
jgi:hypothetical protein